jgi:deoxyadenosine/deoxycytidine kinase
MNKLKVGVVGPCAAGKSTLVAGLGQHGYWGKHIAQEHSYVQDMWQRITNPDVLVYLDVSYPLTIQRRKLDWTEDEYLEEIRRLRHARQHADLYLNTDAFTAQEVLFEVITFLEIAGNR